MVGLPCSTWNLPPGSPDEILPMFLLVTFPFGPLSTLCHVCLLLLFPLLPSCEDRMMSSFAGQMLNATSNGSTTKALFKKVGHRIIICNG